MYRKNICSARLALSELKSIAFIHGGEELDGTTAQVWYDLMGLLPVCDNSSEVSDATSMSQRQNGCEQITVRQCANQSCTYS